MIPLTPIETRIVTGTLLSTLGSGIAAGVAADNSMVGICTGTAVLGLIMVFRGTTQELLKVSINEKRSNIYVSKSEHSPRP